MDTKIKKLGVDVRSTLESGLVITDATQCALELVENSLDAKCTAVAVRINLKNYTIEVVDNGTGISPDDLDLVGERFMTSKCRSSNDLRKNMATFGYRGQALASIIDVCTQLRIRTKSELSSKTLIKIFTKGKSPSVYVSGKGKCARGTTVSVCGFMSTMPVRQKRIMEIFDLREIKIQLEYLALIHNEVCFTLRDDNKGETIFESRSKMRAGLSLTDLFGMSLGKFLVPLNYTEQNIEIQGFVGLQRHSESNLQFFYVNKRIISKSITHKILNSLIDRYLDENCTFMVESPLADEINFHGNKGCHNVYLVQILCPYTDFEMFRNLRRTTVEFKNWDRIFNSLRNAFRIIFNCESSHVCSDLVVQKRKHANLGNSPKNYKMEMGQWKCGIRGVSAKRKKYQINNEQLDNRVKFVQKAVVDGAENISSVEEINEFAERKGNARTPAANITEVGHTEEDCVNRKLPHCGKRKLKRELRALDIKRTGANAILIEFAAWLKSKIRDDRCIRKKYMEFFEQKLTLYDNGKKLKSLPVKRGREPCNGKENGEGCETNELFFKKRKRMKKEKPFVSLPDSVGNDLELNTRLNDKQFKKSKKGKKSTLQNRLHTKIREANIESVKKAISNGLNTLGSVTRSNFLQAEIEQVIPGDSGVSKSYLLDENFLESWISHGNRTHINKNVSDGCMKISRILSTKSEDPKSAAKKRELDSEDFNSMSKCNGNFFKRLSTDTFPNTHWKSVKFYRETEVQTSIKAVTYDKGTRINSQELDEARDFFTASKTGEENVLTHGNSGKSREYDMGNEVPEPPLARLEISFNDNRNITNYSSPQMSESKNSREACVEFISTTSSCLHKCKSDETNMEIWNFSDKTRNGLFKVDSRLANSMHNIHSHEINLPDSLNVIAGPPQDSGCCRRSKHIFGVEEKTQNLPDALSYRDKVVDNGETVPPVFSCIERYNFIPKGLSPTVLDRSLNKLESNNKKIGQGAYDCPDTIGEEKFCELFTKSLLPDDCIKQLKESTAENMIFYESEVAKSCMTKSESQIYALFNSFRFEKDLISNVKVIGQWDNKFIVGKTCPKFPNEKHLLFIFDQHAIDERIQLEKLLKDYRNTEGKFISVKCSPPVKCKLEESKLCLIPALQEMLMNFGVIISVIDSEHVVFHEVPLFLIEDNSDEVEKFLRNLVNDVLEAFSKTRGVRPSIPRIIYNKMSTRACKSAVKFNDALSPDEMTKMITDLVACENPFHCAHGRPSTISVLDLDEIRNQVNKGKKKLSFNKFRKEKL